MVSKKKSYGQYFTPKIISDFMVSQINKDKDSKVLEPSAGKGVFLKSLLERDFNKIDAFEIDSSLENKSSVEIKYEDFLKSNINEKYDVIIGNPPYSRWKNIPDKIKSNFDDPYWDKKINGLSDLLYSFIFKSIDKLKENGELIFITPTFWIQTHHSTPVRKYVYKNGVMDFIITFDEMKIFKKASTMFMIFKFIKKKKENDIKIIKTRSRKKLDQEFIGNIQRLLNLLEEGNGNHEKENLEAFIHPQFSNGKPWNLIHPDKEPLINQLENTCRLSAPKIEINTKKGKRKIDLSKIYKKHELESLGYSIEEFEKIKALDQTYYLPTNQTKINLFNKKGGDNSTTVEERPVTLGDVAEIGNGLVSGLDEAFKIGNANEFTEFEKNKFIDVIKAADLHRYYYEKITPYIFVNDIEDGDVLKSKYPNIYNKLYGYKDRLEKRYSYNKDIPWFHWIFLRNWDLISNSGEKIFTPCKERVNTKGFARFTYVEGNYYNTQDVTIIVKKPGIQFNTKYLVGILNSRLIFKWLEEKGLKRGGVLEFSEKPLSRIPIKMINWGDKREVKLHDKIVKLVDNIIKNNKIDDEMKDINIIVRELYDVNENIL